MPLTNLEITRRVADPRWQPILDLHHSLFETGLRHVFTTLDLPARGYTVALSFVDDAEIRELNARYRQKDKATNVLSFPQIDGFDTLPPHDPVMLGDIVVAFDTINAEAAAQHKTVENHVTHLLVHGFLHLLGFDHLTNDDAAEMEELETEILALLEIADPYLPVD